MKIADNIIRAKLRNVCFIWGSGKTTAANALAEKYGGIVYHTDERARYCRIAEPELQPALCRDVPDYFALDPDDARQWERDIVCEMTPMIIADLIELSGRTDGMIWCEGDIDADSVIRVATHTVCIVNNGKPGDFFDRPEQKHMLDAIKNSDLTEEEKRLRIENAYRIVGDGSNRTLPREITELGVKRIDRFDDSTPTSVAEQIYYYLTKGRLR